MDMQQLPKHTISILVRNKPGVLGRISLVFSRRGFNIDSLVVSTTTDQLYSYMTIACSGKVEILGQIIKQLSKLVDVVHAKEHNPTNSISREMALFKIKCLPENRTEILQIVDHFRATTIDFTVSSVVIQVTGSSEKLDGMIKVLEGYGILEMIRTGKIVIARGEETT